MCVLDEKEDYVFILWFSFNQNLNSYLIFYKEKSKLGFIAKFHFFEMGVGYFFNKYENIFLSCERNVI